MRTVRITDNYSPIPDELLDPWLKALRSGEFEQTKFRLHRLVRSEAFDGEIRPVGYCCMGVACEINRDKFERVDSYGEVEIFDNSDGLLPFVLRDLYGLDGYGTLEVMIQDKYGFPSHLSLASLNDQYDFTFPQIADVLDYFMRERSA